MLTLISLDNTLTKIDWNFLDISNNYLSFSGICFWKFLSVYIYGMLNGMAFFINIWHSVPKDDTKFQIQFMKNSKLCQKSALEFSDITWKCQKMTNNSIPWMTENDK